MALLDAILLFLQAAIFYRLATSSLWISERADTECLKVIYAAAGFSAVLTTGVVLISIFTDAVECVPLHLRMGMSTLLALYSLTSYHIVYLFNNRRLSKRRAKNATTRPQPN